MPEQKDVEKLICKMKVVFPTAEMVKRGFDDATTDRASIKTTIGSINTHLGHVDARLGRIEADVKGVVHHEEFDDLMARVKLLESRLGIESGK